MTPPTTGVLVFDGRCGFCTRAIGWLRLLDRDARITTLPYQQAGAPDRAGATVAACAAEVHFAADGRTLTGAAAVAAALAVALRTDLPERVYSRTAPVQDRVYAWVARHRGRLPGITPWCERYPDLCGPNTSA
ncbi:DCC1-like thiol-disulfide oxidoreductase family protein [Pseudonocardia sp. RS010]|uniref:DCC1-like thiol-disulfide oxidoreductase family protein n=1 Tax=Pseudonocardia sp. RS010 TaxID=3385979 RepID=UPI0039A2F38E